MSQNDLKKERMMTQRLRLTTPIGKRGESTTRLAIAAVLTRLGEGEWELTGAVRGASVDNYDLRRPLSPCRLHSEQDSVREIKAAARTKLTSIAASVLDTDLRQLKVLDSTWIDDSD